MYCILDTTKFLDSMDRKSIEVEQREREREEGTVFEIQMEGDRMGWKLENEFYANKREPSIFL